VEQLKHPEYRGKPLIVGGLPHDKRSVVSTCSYEARKYGVHSAMPTSTAYKKCPMGIFVRPNMPLYHSISQEVMAIFKNYSPDIQQMSIDEAFIDMTGTEKLFGKAEEVAKKLKNEVKEKTGLTISVGIASTKYLAKIASDLQKPDGLTLIQPGTEEEFMLSLPLKKVWGIGNKTLEKINKAGFYTTKDIHNASLSMLETIFGKTTAFFLYNVVRGTEVETFSDTPKNRSLGSETTFEEDLTDFTAIEKNLLQLSNDVEFRLLANKLYAKTLCVKIRYENFTTVTIQETFQSYISSSDDLYEKAKKLFYRKYESGKGIRLLGITLHNVEEKPAGQGELFPLDNPKKQLLEKTIISLQQKNPKNKVIKARLLKTIAVFLLIARGFSSLQAEQQENKAENPPLIFSLEEGVYSLPKEDSPHLFNYALSDSNVEFQFEGFWESQLHTETTFRKNKNGTKQFSFANTIFSQKADLTAWIFLNKAWYFETNFADGFASNTLAAGYKGNGLVKNFRMGNSGIGFSEDYSLNFFGEGNTHSPGLVINLQKNNWKIDAALKYDALEEFEKDFIGNQEVSTSYLSLGNWERGRRFSLINTSISQKVAAVYLQSDTGTYKDAQNRRYQKLDPSQFFISPSEATLLLSQSTNNTILIEFFSSTAGLSEQQEILSALGNFGNETTLSSGFLGETQQYFSATRQEAPLYLEKYSYGNKDNQGFFTQLTDGTQEKTVLIVQNQPYFSPFEIASYYKLDYTNYQEVHIVSPTTNETLQNYDISLETDTNSFVYEDFISQKNSYAKIFITSTDVSLRNPQNRFPLANKFPFTYLTANTTATIENQAEGDFAIQLKNFVTTTNYYIGTKALTSSIKVTKNGVQNYQYTYNPETGLVIFAQKPTNNETIHISWQENTQNGSKGALSGIIGFQRQVLPNLNFDIVGYTYWPVFYKEKFSTPQQASSGNMSLSSEMHYKGKNGYAKNIVTADMFLEDVTGTLRILGMDKTQTTTYYLTKNSGSKVSLEILPSLNAIGNQTLNTFPQLKKEERKALQSFEPVKDSAISGYAWKAQWDFSDLALQENPWVAFNLALEHQGKLLLSSKEFSLSLKIPQNLPEEFAHFDIYLQLGVDANEDVTYENSQAIPTWKISKKYDYEENDSQVVNSVVLCDEQKNPWQTVTVSLSNIDLARLQNYQDARIIIVQNKQQEVNPLLTLFVGPYEIANTEFAITSEAEIIASAPQKRTESIFARENPLALQERARLFNQDKSENFAQYLIFDNFGSNFSKPIIFTQYIEEFSAKAYNNLGFLLYVPKEEELTDFSLILDRPSNSLAASGETLETMLSQTMLSLTIPQEILAKYSNSWNEIRINFETKEVVINKTPITTKVSCYCNNAISPYRLRFGLSPQENNKAMNSGYFIIDEIYLDTIHPEYRITDTLEFSWERKEPILAINNFAFIEDISLFFQGKDIFTLQDQTNSLLATSNFSATIMHVFLESSLALNSENEHFQLESLTHRFASTQKNILFKYLNFSENFLVSQNTQQIEKNNTLSFSIPLKNSNISLGTKANLKQESATTTQNFEGNFLGTFKGKKIGYTIKGIVDTSQKISQQNKNITSQNYFSHWIQASEEQYSSGKENAQNRTEKITLHQQLFLPWNNLSPQITLAGENRYANSGIKQNDGITSFSFSVPFVINNDTFDFSWTKIAQNYTINANYGSYLKDIENYVQNFSQETWFWKTIPFADLFSQDLQKTMYSNLLDSSQKSYTSLYQFSWKRPLAFSAFIDLLCPTSMTLAFSRDIKLETEQFFTDITQIKGNFGFTTVNAFGKFGDKKLFSWYEQDELIQSYSFAVKLAEDSYIPKEFLISGLSFASLYLPKNKIIAFNNNFQIIQSLENLQWQEKIIIEFTRPGKTSFIEAGAKFLIASLKNKPFIIQRKNSLSYEIGYEETFFQSVAILHKLENTLLSVITISLETGLKASFEDKKVFISIPLTLAGKVSF